MKRITFKGLRGQSPRKEPQKPSNESDSPSSSSQASGSETRDLDLPLSPCSQSNSLCQPCFKIDPCACCLSFQSTTLESPKRKTKASLFYTLRKKLTSQKQCQREGWESPGSPTNQQCFPHSHHRCMSVEETHCSSSRKAPYRSRSAERPRSHHKDHGEHSKSYGPKSVQLHKRQIAHGTMPRKSAHTSRRNHKEQLAASKQAYDSESDDDIPPVVDRRRQKSSNATNIDRHLRELAKPFDGYGHASSPKCNDIAVPDTTRSLDCQCSSKSCSSASSGRSSGESEMEDAPATLRRDPSALRHYDQVKEPIREPWSLTKELVKLVGHGWYWGPINRLEAEEKLANQPDGAFLVRDSSDERYLLSLSFRSYGRTLHTRIEHCNGVFSFYAQPESEGYCSIVDLIDHSMNDSQTGVFYYSRARTPGSPSFPVKLTKPVSRFTQVRSLQYLCRFVIRQTTRVDHIQRLPLPSSIKGWLQQKQY